MSRSSVWLFFLCAFFLSEFAQAAIVFRSSSSTSKTAIPANFITVSEPAGVVKDDILIMLLSTTGSDAIPYFSNSWNLIYSGNGGGFYTYIWWTRRGTSAPVYSASWTGDLPSYIHVAAWSGAVAFGSPILTQANTTFVSGAAANPPAITTTIPDTMIVAMAVHSGGYSACAAPAGYTTRASASGIRFCLGDKILASAGVENPGNITGQSSSNFRVALTLALIPDVAVVGQIKLQDLPAGGTFSSVLRSANVLSNDTTFILPDNYGTAGQVLGTDGGGQLSWTSVSSNKIKVCEISIGETGPLHSALEDTSDLPFNCGNIYGETLTISSVECYADAGSPTVMPKITGGANLLSGDLTCGTGSFATGTLNGTPTQVSNATIDGNIITAGGTAKQIVIRITRTLP
jgi:hypothetical protein